MTRGIKNIFIGAVILLILAFWFFDTRFRPSANPRFGLNFSIDHATYLGLDWKKLYGEILADLKPNIMRLTVPWEDVEAEQGRFTFGDFDYILSRAAKNDMKVIVVLGLKQPGWPECHEPAWAKNLESRVKNQAVLDFIEQVVLRYKDSPAVSAWQVENEPFFVFGQDCPGLSGDTLIREIALVKSLDSRPVVTTDSGEKGAWLPTAGAGADIFGSTMYRTVYQSKWHMYLTYPIPPVFYRVKAGILRTFTPVKNVIGVELQAEPWFARDVFETKWEDQKKMMNAQVFESNVAYARAAGFAENYLWGAEWWYYGKEKKGDSELWQAAKKLFSE